MTGLSPEHFFEQAERLILPLSAGPPRQVDLRRAISCAYYGLFHFTLASLADEFVGVTQRSNPRYGLIYRSISHTRLKDLCKEVNKLTPPAKYALYLPLLGFGADMQAFATAFIDLQVKRHSADYNPQARYRTAEAQFAIGTARSAIRRFGRADPEIRKLFLALLLCPPRSEL